MLHLSRLEQKAVELCAHGFAWRVAGKSNGSDTIALAAYLRRTIHEFVPG